MGSQFRECIKVLGDGVSPRHIMLVIDAMTFDGFINSGTRHKHGVSDEHSLVFPAYKLLYLIFLPSKKHPGGVGHLKMFWLLRNLGWQITFL